MGLATAGAIRVGQAQAYAGRARVWLAGVASMSLALLFMTGPMLAFMLAPEVLARWYIDDPAVLPLAASLLIIGGMFQLFDGLQTSSLALLRALGDVRRPTVISLAAFWVVGLPLGYWLSHHQGWGARGIWTGYVVALGIQAAWFVARFFRLVRQGKRGGW